MDVERFAFVMKNFGGRVSRHGALRILLVGAMTLLEITAPSDSRAKRKHKRKNQNQCEQVCNGGCIPQNAICCSAEQGGGYCSSGQICCPPSDEFPDAGSCVLAGLSCDGDEPGPDPGDGDEPGTEPEG